MERTLWETGSIVHSNPITQRRGIHRGWHLVADLIVALDVGGTNTRARIALCGDDAMGSSVRDDIVVQVRSATELYSFIGDVAGEAARHGSLVAAVTAVAGPVLAGRSEVTNWPRGEVIELAELERAGLPLGHTTLVNDVVAGAWGALGRLDNGTSLALAPRSAAGAHRAGGARPGNVVYVAPGTGLGTAALISHELGGHGATAVACETQHTQMPRFAGEIARVADRVASALGHPPSWEDLVSGRGLVHAYDAVCAIASAQPMAAGADDAHRAGAIAAAALAGDDAQALAAVTVFYGVLGHYAQLLALTFLPCAAVFIGGASTEKNLELIKRSPLRKTFGDHPRFSGLLGDVPVHAVGGDVNLEGGIRLATCA